MAISRDAGEGELTSSIVGTVAIEAGVPCQSCEFCRTGHYNAVRPVIYMFGSRGLCLLLTNLWRKCPDVVFFSTPRKWSASAEAPVLTC